MTGILPSYLDGRWQTGTGAGAVVRDAVTADPVTQVSGEDLDLEAAVADARQAGGPALRALDFQARAELSTS